MTEEAWVQSIESLEMARLPAEGLPTFSKNPLDTVWRDG